MRRITHSASDVAAVGYQRHYWDEHWTSFDRSRIERTLRNEFVLPVALRVFARGALLLEAGCGTGKYCKALSRHGYRVVGVDFSLAGLGMLRKMDDGWEPVCGSVLRTPVRDCSFDGALSLGVVEHFVEGPGAALSELARVIRPGGTLLLTVPFQHALWDLNDILWPGRSNGSEPGDAFYQYLHRREEMEEALRAAGFSPEETRYVTRYRGLQDFYPLAPREGNSTVAPRHSAIGGKHGGSLVRLRAAFKAASPSFARSLRDLQIAIAERVLPGRLCGHSLLFVATRQGPLRAKRR